MVLVVCACRIFLNCWYLASVHDINRTEAVTLDKNLVCSGQGGRPRSFRILTQMACHAEQGSCCSGQRGSSIYFRVLQVHMVILLSVGRRQWLWTRILYVQDRVAASVRLFNLIQMVDHTEQGSCMFRAM